MLGIIGRRPHQATTLSVAIFGNCSRDQSISGLIRSWRISRLKPLNSAVPATRKRSWPKRLVTIFVASSRMLTVGAASWLSGVWRWTVIE